MSATLLDGRQLSKEIRAEIATEVEKFTSATKITPCLAAVLVGADPASKIYVRNKEKACEKVGLTSCVLLKEAATTTEELLELVRELNHDPTVHGILVQLPLPDQIDQKLILDAVSPEKDVDAFHPHNVGLLMQGRPRFLPCTPQGIQQMLIRSGIETAGRHVVVVGRSDIVGKPMGMMLVQRGEGGNATVTFCHSRTRHLGDVTRGADILIVAIGQAKFITADMVKPGAAVVDVGMNRTPEGLFGDVDFEAAKEVAGAITPVPGGVGPLTIAMLLKNTLQAAKQMAES